MNVINLISDIKQALDAEAYFSALALILILPDICAKAEYGDTARNKERYINWYNEYIGEYEKSPKLENEVDTPYLSGEVVYQLRCMILHQGTLDVDKDKIEEVACKIDKLTLITQKSNKFDIYVDSSSVSQDEHATIQERTYAINIQRLNLIITEAVKKYYENNKEKFDFMKWQIIDFDKTAEKNGFSF